MGEASPPDWHVYPVRDLVDHDTESRACWCGPRLAVNCPECLDEEGRIVDPECWKCGGDTKLTVDPECLEPVLVIHNAADGRD